MVVVSHEPGAAVTLSELTVGRLRSPIGSYPARQSRVAVSRDQKAVHGSLVLTGHTKTLPPFWSVWTEGGSLSAGKHDHQRTPVVGRLAPPVAYRRYVTVPSRPT